MNAITQTFASFANARTLLLKTLALVLMFISCAVARAQDTPPIPPPPPLVVPTTTPSPIPPRPILTNDIVVQTLPQQTPQQISPQTSPRATSIQTPLPITASEGVLVETIDEKPILTQSADEGFNPASAIKVATALAAIHTLGANYRFTTAVLTNGQLDKTTGTLNGDLYISSRDISFHDEHAVMLARELNSLGIRTVNGNLIVTPGFILNFSSSPHFSGERLLRVLDAMQRPGDAVRAWNDMQRSNQFAPPFDPTISFQTPTLSPPPSPLPGVQIRGSVRVDVAPQGARLLLEQRSSTLVDILKVILAYSNNFMAEKLGDYIGGAGAVRRVLVSDFGINSFDVQISSTAGLGFNRVTPRAMLKIYRALVAELAKRKLQPSAVLPVAGIDPGTLKKRFTDSFSRGSVIAKTGTLPHTGGGTSALVGQFKTRNGGVFYFVIFNRGHHVLHSRALQDQLITSLQNARGGAAAFDYKPQALALRLAETETKSEGGDVNEKRSN